MPLSFLTRILSSPLSSLAAGTRDQLYWDVFAIPIIIFCRQETYFSVYLKLRNTWLSLWATLWEQDLTLFALYNLWHFWSSLLGLAQSRENEFVEEKENRKMWIYQGTAVTRRSKSCSSLFCLKQILLLRTHLLIFLNFYQFCPVGVDILYPEVFRCHHWGLHSLVKYFLKC